MVMVVLVLVRSQVIAGNVAPTFFRNGADRFAGNGIVVGAADIHLDGGRLGARR